MSDYYFLSYARIDLEEDPEEHIHRFYEDLDREVRRKLVLKGRRGGFFDSESTQHGERWPDVIQGALRSCRSLIGLYSRGYFASEYCGKEWAVFHSRIAGFHASQAGSQRPALFFPILFDPPEDLPPLPPVVAAIQYAHDDYPKDYVENGLRYLMARNNLKDVYRDFLDAFVRKLLHAVETWNLEAAGEIPDFMTVRSAFHASAGDTPAGLLLEGTGPDWVDFVYVAARRSELQPIRTRTDAYGETGGVDWKPYWPELTDRIALLAQEVATQEKFLTQPVTVVTDLPAWIREAQKKKRIVVVLADTWTLKLPFYRDLMRNYDQWDFWNSCVLIAWNQKDEETAAHRDSLREAVRIALINKSRRRDERHFVEGIDSPDSLRRSLKIALQKIKLAIIEISEDLKRVETEEVFHKPEIPVPA